MSPIRFIRVHVFRVRQHEFADIAGVAQASVSRWESGGVPTLTEMQRIRAEARRRRLEWSDSFFFEVPAEFAEKAGVDE